jgi:HAD superfamily hydrolase (TIGR01549 family)
MTDPKKNIKAVLFDLDGTLRLNQPASRDVFAECVKGMGLEPSEEDHVRAERWEHFYFANSLDIKEDGEKFKDDRKGFWVNFTKRRLVALGIQKHQATELAPHVSNCMEANYKPQAQLPNGLHTLLKTLQDKGCVLGVVSNREEPFHNELEELGLKDYFRFSLAGGEVQSYKPHPHIFERALELAGTSAHETVYVGDNYFADVVGALRAGLMPVLFDPSRLFPDAECDIIRSFDELHELLM